MQATMSKFGLCMSKFCDMEQFFGKYYMGIACAVLKGEMRLEFVALLDDWQGANCYLLSISFKYFNAQCFAVIS